ncbi:MAG TPA: hypothetical protein PLX69_25340 [Leptospiraceae bacterium]|nr:hypothetical protein [Leptospiraceae bacterium]HRG77910.1 hypothetical protein [Leptospiraceae bacterium]
MFATEAQRHRGKNGWESLQFIVFSQCLCAGACGEQAKRVESMAILL